LLPTLWEWKQLKGVKGELCNGEFNCEEKC
jgi:hypothetical protein